MVDEKLMMVEGYEQWQAELSDIQAWLGERDKTTLDKSIVQHLLQVAEGVLNFCEPKQRQSYEDATEHYGGQALDELAKIVNVIKAQEAGDET